MRRCSLERVPPWPTPAVAVVCAAAVSPGDVRLTRKEVSGDGGAVAGRLEVFTGAGWGTVCGTAAGGADAPRSFSAAAAGVACRQLGFAQGFQIQSMVQLPALCSAALGAPAAQVMWLSLCCSWPRGDCSARRCAEFNGTDR